MNLKKKRQQGQTVVMVSFKTNPGAAQTGCLTVSVAVFHG